MHSDNTPHVNLERHYHSIVAAVEILRRCQCSTLFDEDSGTTYDPNKALSAILDHLSYIRDAAVNPGSVVVRCGKCGNTYPLPLWEGALNLDPVSHICVDCVPIDPMIEGAVLQEGDPPREGVVRMSVTAAVNGQRYDLTQDMTTELVSDVHLSALEYVAGNLVARVAVAAGLRDAEDD